MTAEYKILPASAGTKWVSQAIAFSLKHPKPLILTIFLYLFALFAANLLGAIPFIGWIVNIAMLLAVPALNLGLFSVLRGIERDEQLSFDLFLRPIQENRDPLLICGVLYILGTIIMVVLIGVILYFGLSHVSMGVAINSGDLQTIVDNLFTILIIFLLCLIPVFLFIMAFIFAPLLVGWHQIPVLEAYKLSFFSCLKNWKALSVNGGVWLLVGFCFGFAVALIAGILTAILPKTLAIIILSVAYLVLIFSMSIIGWANTYYSYKAIFQQEES